MSESKPPDASEIRNTDVTHLSGSTRLRRRQALGLQLHGNSVVVSAGARTLTTDDLALTILEAFKTTQRLDETLQQIRGSMHGVREWVEIVSRIQDLHSVGALLAEDAVDSSAEVAPGFAAPATQIRILGDRSRTATLISGIEQLVHPGDVVLDLGTGTGVLAAACVRAGASRVYAIEETTAAEFAQSFWTRNGVSDFITLVRGRSTRTSLPERCDVVVSELLDAGIFNEEILECTLDARQRFLKADARHLVENVALFAVPIRTPALLRRKSRFTPEAAADWSKWYGFDFDVAATVSHDLIPIVLKQEEARTCAVLAPAVGCGEIDLRSFAAPVFQSSCRITFQQAGELDAMLIYFQARIAGGGTLTNAIDSSPADCHWRVAGWMFPRPVRVRADSTLDIAINYLGRLQLQVVFPEGTDRDLVHR